MKNCNCGSNLPRRGLVDARGIFCTFVCDDCEQKKRAKFRPEIFEDSQYECSEPVQPEDYQ